MICALQSPWVLDKLRAQTTRNDQVGDKVVPNFPDWLYIILNSFLFDSPIFSYFIFIVSVMVYTCCLCPYLIKWAGLSKYQSFCLLLIFLVVKYSRDEMQIRYTTNKTCQAIVAATLKVSCHGKIKEIFFDYF